MEDNKVNSGLLEFSEDQKVFVALDAETGEVQKAVTIDGDGVETDIQGVQPSGKITITENGTDINVAPYATADVSVEGGELSNDLQTVTIPALTLTGEYSDFGNYQTMTKLADAVAGVDPLIDYNAEQQYMFFVRNNDGVINPEIYKIIDGVSVGIVGDSGEIFLLTMAMEAYTIQVPSDTLVFYIANSDLVSLYGATPFCEIK